jgi:hypothetical protein
MLKVIIIDRCEYCNGEAYVYAGEYKDEFGEHPIYRPCTVCKGVGEREKAISLIAFADLLDRSISMEPDWAELAKAEPISNIQDSLESAGI